MSNSTIANSRDNIFENLEGFLHCGTDICHWVYNSDGTLLTSSSSDLIFNQIFIYTRCHSEMLKHFRISRSPVQVSTVLGIEWAAAYQISDALPDRIHVIGPVLNTDFDPALFRADLSSYEIPADFKGKLLDLIAALPVVPSHMFFNYTLMLHYAASGEHIKHRDIVPLSVSPENMPVSSGTSSSSEQKKNRQQVYLAERALLENVRTGNLNYRSQIEHASQLSAGVNSRSGPISQSRISVVVFSSLCTRAAIEGGLSPELAYSIGDRYIQQATRSTSVTGLQTVADSMYDEFIRTVHIHRQKPEMHAQIRACKDFIDANPEENISLADLAKRVNYTEYYLSRKFHQEVGCTVNEYIHIVRIERAKLLLTASTLMVYEIAQRLNYSSATHFSDTFRKITGVYPSEYREKNQRV